MTELESITRLLVEIRDLQAARMKHVYEQAELSREDVARFVADQKQSLANQEAALRSQRATARLYRVVVFAFAVLVGFGLILISSR